MHSSHRRIPKTSPDRETQIGELARSQRGLGRTSQLIALGVPKSTIVDQVARGRWQRLHRGILYLGLGPVPRETRWLAAVMAVGHGAALSGQAGAEHLGLLRWKSRRIDVTSLRGSGRSHSGFHSHRTRYWPSRDRLIHGGISTLAPARAVVDVARFVDMYELVSMIDRAFRQFRTSVDAIERRNDRLRCTVGHAELVEAIAHYRAGSHGVRSRLEVLLARAIRRAGMPAPYLNVVLATPRGPVMLDLWWPDLGCGIELDDHGHDQPHMVASDAMRNLGLLEAGIDLIRVPNEAVDQMLEAVLDRVEALLRRHRWRGTRVA